MVSASDSFRRDLLQGLYRFSWRRSASAWRSFFPQHNRISCSRPLISHFHLPRGKWAASGWGAKSSGKKRKKKEKNSPGNRLETPSPPSLPPAHSGLPLIPLLPIPPHLLLLLHPLPTLATSAGFIFPFHFPGYFSTMSNLCACVCVRMYACVCVSHSFVQPPAACFPSGSKRCNQQRLNLAGNYK